MAQSWTTGQLCTFRAKERAHLQDIACRLQVISDELNGLKKSIGGSAIEQAALSAAMASAWIDLLASKSRSDLGTVRQEIMNSIGRVLLRRPGLPEEVAERVAFVASDRDPFIHW
jgi:hypothetical protein